MSLEDSRSFVLRCMEENVTKTVEKLILPNIFGRKVRRFPVKSVSMLRIIRKSYPSYRLNNREYNDLVREVFHWHPDFSELQTRQRHVRLLDFIRREDMNNPPNKRYKVNNSQRGVTLPPGQHLKKLRAAALRGLNGLPRELRHKILYDAGLMIFPETFLNGKVHGNMLMLHDK